MITLTYDHSFEGLLSAIFEVYAMKYRDAEIHPAGAVQENLFAQNQPVATDADRAARVWGAVQKQLSKSAQRQLWCTFLSEAKGMETMLLKYIQYAMTNGPEVEKDFSHVAVRYVYDTAKKVHREKHRMEAFIRFKLSADGLYLAEIQPDFNVMPLLREHFQKRYADQRWMIYDTRRNYGLYYDMEVVEGVQLNPLHMDGAAALQDMDGDSDPSMLPAKHVGLHEHEQEFQRLWAHYFENVNIKERRNMKLHIQHMPRRYWRFLTEKQPVRPRR